MAEAATGGEVISGEARRRSTPKAAWEPKKRMDYASWAFVGRYLGGLDRVSQWWIGDWLVYGKARWGRTYGEAVKITGYDYGSLRNMASLALEFDVSRRRDDLAWSHHAAVASLARAEQDHWLARSAELRWSVSDLRTELRAARRRPPGGQLERRVGAAAGSPDRQFFCPSCGAEVQLSDAMEAIAQL